MSSPTTHVSETDLEEDTFYKQDILRYLEVIQIRQRDIQASQTEFRRNQASLLSSVQNLQTLQTGLNEELRSIKDKINQLYSSSQYESHWDTVGTQAIFNSSPYQLLPSDVFPEEGEHLPLVMGPGPQFPSVATSTHITPQRTLPFPHSDPMAVAASSPTLDVGVNSFGTNLPEVMGPGPYVFSDAPGGQFMTRTTTPVATLPLGDFGPTTAVRVDFSIPLHTPPLENRNSIPASTQDTKPTLDFSSPIQSDTDSLYRVTQRPGGLGIAMAYCNNATSDSDSEDSNA
ncbi:hypothetical protein K435DRAFT_858571 [Dendrothele bispora CBS 962.96]|uniref:Uncharacterized protein n=1 Tax=Dendrothele bispora (strain CBS 962.96) TaxID=1314807 RepID=A0A4S8M2V3_DENBC|nr:hypothetical protein K435DRAFT_858571 [Dendrothele bispora CBS 962.96]